MALQLENSRINVKIIHIHERIVAFTNPSVNKYDLFKPSELSITEPLRVFTVLHVC